MLVYKMPMSVLLLSCALLSVESVVLGVSTNACAGERRLDKDALLAIAKATPRLDSEPDSAYRAFQFECRWTHILPDGKTGRVRCVIERHVNRQGLLVLSAQGLPLLQVNNEGLLGLSRERPGELNYAEQGSFRFQCVPDQPIGSELGLELAGRLSKIDVDIAALISRALAREHSVAWDSPSRTLKLVEMDGFTTSIRFRQRADVGFPIESFSRFTQKGHGVTLTNFDVRAPYRDESHGPYHLTQFRRNSKGQHPSEVLHSREPLSQWLRDLMLPQGMASTDGNPNLVDAGEQLESWIQLHSALEKRPIPEILNDDPIGPTGDFFPQRRWFRRIKFELTEAGAMPAMEVTRAPYRVDFIGYPRELSAAYVRAWLGYKRTARLYEFLIGVASDPHQPTYNRVSAISLLGRTGVPFGLTDIATLERKVEVDEPHVLACWSACRLLLGAPREQDLARANLTADWSDWPWAVQTMAVHGLVNCRQVVNAKDWSKEFLTTAANLGDGNLDGTDFITALAAMKHGRSELMKQVKSRNLGPLYTKTALLALESSCEKGTKDRVEFLEIAQEIALDYDNTPNLRAIAANVAATGDVERAFVQKLLESVKRSEDVQVIMTLPLYAEGHLSELIDEHSGLPSLVRSKVPRVRHAAADAISELPTQVSLTQRHVDTMLPAVTALLNQEDEVVAGLGINALRRMHQPGIRFDKAFIEKLVIRTHNTKNIMLYCGFIAILDQVSDNSLIAQCIKPDEAVPQPTGNGLDWWRSHRKSITAAVDEWWRTQQGKF